MIDFKELKLVIKKACFVEKTEDIDSRFGFTIDIEKLEQFLALEHADLHVIGFGDKLRSKVPTYEDLQVISEYIYKKEIINNIYNGSSQIATFMLYTNMNDLNGTVECKEEQEEIYGKLNNPENIDIGLVNSIITENPIYRALVVRRFNYKEDKFDYAIYFRSNRVMINYIKELKEEGDFEEPSGEVEVIEPVEDSVAASEE